MRIWIVLATLLFVLGCGPSTKDLRSEYELEKNKLGEREKALLEFERFNVDLAGQERIEKAAVDRVAESDAKSKTDKGQKYVDNQRYVENERKSEAVADRLVTETHAKLVEEVKEQRQRVADIEARLRQAEK